jgi:hypothetical protein
VANAGRVPSRQVDAVHDAIAEATTLPIFLPLITSTARWLTAGKPAAGRVGICRRHCRVKTIASANAAVGPNPVVPWQTSHSPCPPKQAGFGLEPPAAGGPGVAL